MINPISVRYHLAEGGVHLRLVHGRARLALTARGIDLGPEGWAVLSEEAGAAVQKIGGPAQAHDRQTMVARADLEAWLTGATPTAAPSRLPLPVSVDWLRLAESITSLPVPAPRGVIVELLIGAGMSVRANPEVIAWGRAGVESAT